MKGVDMLMNYFNTTIKPYNDVLAGTLGIKTIEIRDESPIPYPVPVSVPVMHPDGHIFNISNWKLNGYLLLGLVRRYRNE
jgi:hypothetical protein